MKMLKAVSLCLILFLVGCKSDDNKLNECLVSSLKLAQQGYAANPTEFFIIVNSCMGNADWQKTTRGQEVMKVVKDNWK